MWPPCKYAEALQWALVENHYSMLSWYTVILAVLTNYVFSLKDQTHVSRIYCLANVLDII